LSFQPREEAAAQGHPWYGRIQIEIIAWTQIFPFAKTASALCGEGAVQNCENEWVRTGTRDPPFSLKTIWEFLWERRGRRMIGASLVGAFAILSY